MKVIVGNGNFGIEEIKNLLQDLFQTMRLDRNNDGTISKGEWFGAISGLVPSLFNIGDVAAEVKDLTKDEFDEIIRWAGKNFPDYTGVDNDVEDLVRQTILVVAEMIKWVNLLAAVRHNRNETPGAASPAAIAPVEAPAQKGIKGAAAAPKAEELDAAALGLELPAKDQEDPAPEN